MRLSIYILLLAFCVASCNRHSSEWEAVNRVETYIEEKPDSALAVLQDIDRNSLAGRAERAKYALLLSMAQDKNFIDKIDFETLQPAIDYYQHHGTATDKLRMRYYQGRIYTNRGDNANAMICFNRALHEGQESDDVLTKARTHFALANMYNVLYKKDRAIEENKNAAEYFKQAGRLDSYVNCLIRIINGYTVKSDWEEAERYLRMCRAMLDSVGIKGKRDFYANNLIYAVYNGEKEEIIPALTEYLENVPSETSDWLGIASAYSAINEDRKAYTAIQNYKLTTNARQNMRYYAILAQVYEAMNNPEKALDAYRSYLSTSDSISLATFEQDVAFVERTYNLELDMMKEREAKNRTKFLTVIFALVFVFTVVVICIWVHSRLVANAAEKKRLEDEKETYRLQCLQIEEERDNLTRLLAQNNELSAPARTALMERVTFLNRFFATYLKNNGEPDTALRKEIECIFADRDSFMASTRLAFAASHPAFIQYLQSKGLTEWEISYCCLYALGLNGKEVGAYIKMRSHYNQSSIIREKLGINEHDTNLGIYLRKLLNS